MICVSRIHCRKKDKNGSSYSNVYETCFGQLLYKVCWSFPLKMKSFFDLAISKPKHNGPNLEQILKIGGAKQNIAAQSQTSQTFVYGKKMLLCNSFGGSFSEH